MLKLKDYRSKSKGLSDLLPYAALIAPGVVLCKDGSLCAAYEMHGADTASSTRDELMTTASRFNFAAKQLKTGFMLHVDSVRIGHNAYPDAVYSHFPDSISQMIDDERRSFFTSSGTEIPRCYETKTFLGVTFKPNFNEEKISALIQDNVKVSGNPIEKSLATFENTLAELEDALSSELAMKRLAEYQELDEQNNKITYSNLLSYIQYCITGDLHPLIVPKNPMYLDFILGSENLLGGLKPKIGKYHIAAVALDGLPQESYPAMMSALDSLQIPYRYSTRYICLDNYDSQKEIERYQKNWGQQVISLMDQMFPKANKVAKQDVNALSMKNDAGEALAVVQSGEVGAGFLTSNIILLNEDPEMLIEYAREIRRIIQSIGFGCRIEDINALEAWLGSLPANGWANIRRPLVNSLNLSHLLPLNSIYTGRKTNPCPFYPEDAPCLSVVTTEGSTPFWLNLHEGDIGHTMIIGPTGSGKSTLLGLLAAQFRRYENSQVYCFDKGNSMLPLCLGVGGSHYDIGKGDLAFTPLQNIHDEDERIWAENWVCDMISLQLGKDQKLLPAHKHAIHTAMLSLASNPPNMRSLTDFYHILQNSDVDKCDLKGALRHYTLEGSMGKLLDSSSDTLGLDPFMVFEIEGLMELGEENLLPVLNYIFHRIEKSLRGQPTLLILDEAWVMLGHPVFKAKIREWLKVFRKANCAVVLATQSLTDVARSGIVDVLNESCLTKILLANREAKSETQRELYQSLGLNSRQIQIISEATPKREYYVTSPSGRRLVNLSLGKKTLAFIGASSKEDISRVRELHTQHGQGWTQKWLEERGVA